MEYEVGILLTRIDAKLDFLIKKIEEAENETKGDKHAAQKKEK